MADNNTFLAFNRDPVDAMVAYLHRYFAPDTHEPGASLAISGGLNGARLTHSHTRQFSYVLQSLTLWCGPGAGGQRAVFDASVLVPAQQHSMGSARPPGPQAGF